MKKNFNLFALLLVIVTILSSCVTKDISIVKRKYSSGYYVSVNSHKKAKDVSKEHQNNLVSTAKQAEIQTRQEIQSKIQAVSELLLEASNNSNTQNITASTFKNLDGLKVKHNKNTFQKSLGINAPERIKSKEPFHIGNENKAKINHEKNKSNHALEASKVLLIILSLFPILALIAMYIHDGNSITLNFWIDLLLHLTLIGYAIFAILVVLDVVDLA